MFIFEPSEPLIFSAIKEQKDRGQYGGRVPYLWSVQIVDDPEKKPAGRLCESGGNQTGKYKPEKSRFHGEVRRTRRRMKKGVKGIGELCRKGMDGTDTHIDGKAFWQAQGVRQSVPDCWLVN